MSDSDRHSPLDVPYLQVGKAAGAFAGNRHIAAPKGTQLADYRGRHNSLFDRINRIHKRVKPFLLIL
jgi:hypothetical protein